MRKPNIYVISGKPMTMKEIAQECGCSAVTALLYFNNHTLNTDTENFRNLKDKLNRRNFVPGYVSLQTIAQKTHIDKKVIFEFLKTIPDGKYSILMKQTKRNLPMLMLKTVELTDFIKELRDYKKGLLLELEAKKAKQDQDDDEDEEDEEDEMEPEIKIENLEQLKKDHPLITDERLFCLNFFPKIDSYTFLTECNCAGGLL